jgi:hypothetical protein
VTTAAFLAFWEALFTRLLFELSRLLRLRADSLRPLTPCLGPLVAFELWHDHYLNSQG